MKQRSKVIATSIATIAMCASLAVGGTFALFTSESEVNIAVTSGKVDVFASVNEESLKTYSMGAIQEKGKFQNGGTAAFNAQSQLELSLMTPGDKAEFTVDIANNSNVAIQYKVSFDVKGGLVGALDCDATNAENTWIFAEAGKAIDSVAVSVELPESVDDTYQNVTDTTISVKVEAVQGNAHTGGATIEDSEEDVALENVFTEDLLKKEDIVVKLGKANLTWETGAGIGSTPFGNENTKTLTIVGESPETSKLTATGSGVGAIRVKDGTLTIQNVEIIDETVSYAEDSWEYGYLELGGGNADTLVFENCVFNKAIQISGNATFKNCKFNSNADNEYAVWVCGGSASFEDCYFTGPRGLKMHEDYGTEIVSVTIENCTFESITKKPGVAMGTLNADTSVTIKNSQFIDCQAGDQGLYMYETDTDVTSFTFVNENNVVGTSANANTDADLDAAIKNGAVKIELGSGNYIIPDSAKGKNLTIVGNGDTVVATQDDGSYEGCDYSLDGATVTFENITINTDSTTYTGYARLNATYNNCTINGTYTLYGDSVFNNCTFNVSGDVYNIWTWGAPTAVFNNCTFNSDGKAMFLYGTVDTKLTINNCVFNDKGGLTDLKAAIEIGNDYNKSYTLTVTKTTVNGYEINDKGINTGTTLWANKNSMGQDKLNVIVDGVDVY